MFLISLKKAFYFKIPLNELAINLVIFKAKLKF